MRKSTTTKARLGIERLDDRITPAVTNVTLAAGGTLQVNGSNGSDAIIVRRVNGLVTIDGWNRAFTDAQVKKVEVSARAGDDAVLILEDAKAAAIPVVIDGGTGNDFLAGSKGNDLIAGGAGADYLLGLGGNDYLLGQGGDDCLSGGTGADQVYGGAGYDRFIALRAGDTSDKIGGKNAEATWATDKIPVDALAWYQKYMGGLGPVNHAAAKAPLANWKNWSNLSAGLVL